MLDKKTKHKKQLENEQIGLLANQQTSHPGRKVCGLMCVRAKASIILATVRLP